MRFKTEFLKALEAGDPPSGKGSTILGQLKKLPRRVALRMLSKLTDATDNHKVLERLADYEREIGAVQKPFRK